MTGPAFAVVTVLHDSAADLERLLASLDRHLPARPALVAVDTGSMDAGPVLARAWGAEVLELGAGTGFGAANNAGLARVDEQVTVLLNPDVELLDDGLLALVATAARGASLDVPRLLNADGSIQRSAHPPPGRTSALLPAAAHPRLLPRRVSVEADPWRAEAPREVGWAIAAALAVRTDVLRRVGAFDPEAFLFFEDMELCLRAARQGVPTVLHPQVRLLHLGGHSTGAYYGSEPHQEIARRRREVVADRLGRRSLALDDAAQALTFATRTAARAAVGKDARRPAAQLRALVRARKDRR